MGSVAEAMSRFAQPLVDATDGSTEQLQRALTLSQVCWNLALMPEEQRGEFLAKLQPALQTGDDELQEFHRTVVTPMIQRHQEMFLGMYRPASKMSPIEQTSPPGQRIVKKYAGTGRNERRPCGTGKKYKLCCGR